MGAPINIISRNGTTTFNLSSKNESYKTKLDIAMDSDDFDALVRGTVKWFVHEYVRTGYLTIRSTLYPENTTVHLTREIVSRYVDIGEYDNNDKETIVVNRKNADELDLRKSNLITMKRIDHICKVRKDRVHRHEPYRNLPMTFIHGKYYQCYDGKTYVGSSKCIEKLKKKVDKYLENKNE